MCLNWKHSKCICYHSTKYESVPLTFMLFYFHCSWYTYIKLSILSIPLKWLCLVRLTMFASYNFTMACVLCQHNIFKNRIQRLEVFTFSVYELLCVLPTADCKPFMESRILAPWFLLNNVEFIIHQVLSFILFITSSLHVTQ